MKIGVGGEIDVGLALRRRDDRGSSEAASPRRRMVPACEVDLEATLVAVETQRRQLRGAGNGVAERRRHGDRRRRHYYGRAIGGWNAQGPDGAEGLLQVDQSHAVGGGVAEGVRSLEQDRHGLGAGDVGKLLQQERQRARHMRRGEGRAGGDIAGCGGAAGVDRVARRHKISGRGQPRLVRVARHRLRLIDSADRQHLAGEPRIHRVHGRIIWAGQAFIAR